MPAPPLPVTIHSLFTHTRARSPAALQDTRARGSNRKRKAKRTHKHTKRKRKHTIRQIFSFINAAYIDKTPYLCSRDKATRQTEDMDRHIHFTKMHGAGNDYIYVYTPLNNIPDPAEASIVWSKPHFGIGSDGIILIGDSPVPEADFSMHIFNNDGSEALMCGNGVRCAAKFVYDHMLTDKTTIAIDTLSGIKVIRLHLDGNGTARSATVDMGEPLLHDKALLSTPDGGMTDGVVDGHRGTFVSMGNPHFVCFVPDATAVDVPAEGARLEHSPAFPQRCNIEFVSVKPDGTLRMRVWERGSGVTMACGTGACATAVAACLTGRSGRRSLVEMDGGTLEIRWDGESGHILMTGPAVTVFEGEVPLPEDNR